MAAMVQELQTKRCAYFQISVCTRHGFEELEPELHQATSFERQDLQDSSAKRFRAGAATGLLKLARKYKTERK